MILALNKCICLPIKGRLLRWQTQMLILRDAHPQCLFVCQNLCPWKSISGTLNILGALEEKWEVYLHILVYMNHLHMLYLIQIFGNACERSVLVKV